GGALMLLALLVFVAVTGAMLGGYAALTYVPGMLAERRLARRLREVSTDAARESPSPDATVVRRLAEGPLPAVDRFMARTRAGSWLNRLIEQSGVGTTASAVIVISLVAALACAVGTALFVRIPFAPLVVAVVGGLLP